MNMKRILILAIVCMIGLLPVAAQKELTILHTNDTHSCIMPLGKTLADTLFAGRGGFLRRIAMIKEQRQQHPDLLLFDSGDFSQGSPYYTLFKGDVEIVLMNEMRYDAATIGNHEFDFGIDNLARIIKMAKFPFVCTNYDFTGTPLKSLVKPWIIIRRDGVKIGIFGLSPQPKGLISEKNYLPIKYIDPVKTALETATFLKQKKKCDMVICISHLGYNINGIDDVEMVRGSRDIDLVLGGHSHTFLKQLAWEKNLDGKQVPIDQNGKSGIYIGDICVKLYSK